MAAVTSTKLMAENNGNVLIFSFFIGVMATSLLSLPPCPRCLRVPYVCLLLRCIRLHSGPTHEIKTGSSSQEPSSHRLPYDVTTTGPRGDDTDRSLGVNIQPTAVEWRQARSSAWYLVK